MSRLLWLVVLLCGVPAAAQTFQDPRLEAQAVAVGLDRPTSMVFVGDDDILVLQKNDGRVRRVLAGVLQPGAVLDVPVTANAERGLLGIARDPDFVNNRHLYLLYTESATGQDGGLPAGNRVYRYTWNGSQLVDPRRILDLPATPGPNHNGGVLTFGPDDRLYVVIGDLNRDGKLQNYPAGPDPDDSSVILRVDVDGRGLPDNPFAVTGNPAHPLNRYYGYGVRNSFGIAFDPLTGTLWGTEAGTDTMDEVNRYVRGFNGGWEQLLGPEQRAAGSRDDLWMAPGATYVDPVFAWVVPVTPTAITFAASRVLGCETEHALLVGDNSCGQLYRFQLNAARDGLQLASAALLDGVADNLADTCLAEVDEVLLGRWFGQITDLENGPDGRLYAVSYNRGEIIRVGPRADAPGDDDADGVAEACDCDPVDPGAFAEPREVPRLRLSQAAPVRLGWDAQRATAGSATTYTVVSGELSALRASAGFAGACELAGPLPEPHFADVRAAPAAGDGFYYLVRAANACATGTLGSGSGSPDPRDLLYVMPLPPCQ